jgi:hypothetical protein
MASLSNGRRRFHEKEEQAMKIPVINEDAILAWTVWLSCTMPDGIDENCQPVSEAQQMRNACPQLGKYSDQELDRFVTDVFAYQEEHPEIDFHKDYVWKPPVGYRGAYHPSWRKHLDWSRKQPRCPTCGQITQHAT